MGDLSFPPILEYVGISGKKRLARFGKDLKRMRSKILQLFKVIQWLNFKKQNLTL